MQDSESGRPIPLTERRLRDVAGMCGYLSFSADTIRELANGLLAPARIRVPGPGGSKVLFDRMLVDQIVLGWRTPGRP